MKKNKKLLIGASVIGVLVVILAIVLLPPLIKKMKVAFEIDGEKYTESQVDEDTKFAVDKGLSRDQARDAMKDYQSRRSAAGKAGIRMTDEQLKAAAKASFPYGVPGNAWSDMVIYDKALSDFIALDPVEQIKQYYVGHVFIFDFSRKIASIDSDQDYQPEGYGDAAAIAEDKAYAKSRAEYYRQQLVDKTMAEAQIVEAIKQDRRLSEFGVVGVNGSTAFKDINQEDPNHYIPPQIEQYLISGNVKAGVNSVQLAKMGIVTPTGDDKDVDARYFFVVSNQPIPKGGLAGSFKDNLEMIRGDK